MASWSIVDSAIDHGLVTMDFLIVSIVHFTYLWIVHFTKSITGKPIRLTDERWVHIVEGHPEMAGYLNDVLLAVDNPSWVVEGGDTELLALMYMRPDKLLVVVYKEESNDGFIITSFFTSKIESLLNRKIVWQK